MSGITTDSSGGAVKLELFVDEGNSDFLFVRAYTTCPGDPIQAVDDFEVDGTPYVATGPVKPFNELEISPSPNDFLVKVTSNDTTGGFLLSKVTSSSGNVSIVEINDGAAEQIDLNVSEGNLDHDALLNFVPNEHINHTSVQILGGDGLSGGGDIAVSRTLNVAINPETSVTPQSGDEVLISDVSDSNNIKKTTAQEIADLSLAYVDTTVSPNGLINQSTTLEPFLELVTNVPVTSEYKIDWAYVWSYNDNSTDFIAELRVNGTVIWEHRQEPKDVAGTGVTLPVIGGGTANTGTDQRHMEGMHEVINLNSGSNTIGIYFAGSNNNQEAAIYRGRISIREWK